MSDEGLALIARAAEGSVRDSLSLLDQAIVQAGLDGGEVSFEQVRLMLGLADRIRVLDLFGMAALGDGKGAITEMRAQYDDGADPAVVMRDLMDICHEVSRAKTLGEEAEFEAAPDQVERIQRLADQLSMGQLTRLWQILTQSHNEVRQAPVPLAAAEMAMLKLAVAGQMPPPELAAQIIEQAQKIAKDGGEGLPVLPVSSSPSSYAATSSSSMPMTASTPSNMSTSQRSTVPQSSSASPNTAQLSAPKPVTSEKPTIEITSLVELVEALPRERIKLKSDIERYVRPIQFKRQNIRAEIIDGAPSDLIGKMVGSLQDLTGVPWLISPEKSGGEPSIAETRRQAKADQDAKDRAHPAFNHPLLRQAKLLGIKDKQNANVIKGDFGQGNDVGSGVPDDYMPPDYYNED